MTPHTPVEDPSDRGSLVDRTVAYVRGNILLRIALVITLLDYVGGLLLVIGGKLRGDVAGFLALMSVLAWFFAVLLPVMNREVRVRLGGTAVTYWGEVAEMFFRVLLCALVALHTAALVYAAVLDSGAS